MSDKEEILEVILLGSDSLESKLLEAELSKNPSIKVQKVGAQDPLKIADNIKNNVPLEQANGKPIIIYLPNLASDYNNPEFAEQLTQIQVQYPRVQLVRAYEFVHEADIPKRAGRLGVIPRAEAGKLVRERVQKMKQSAIEAKRKHLEDQTKLEQEMREEAKNELVKEKVSSEVEVKREGEG